MKTIMGPKRFTLNVGGTRYEVSDSLLDQFQDSMLRKITSDAWNNHVYSDDGDEAKASLDLNNNKNNDNKEIFIERDGGRFKFVLDYMRDGQVFLPLSVPRSQIVSDMEYYGIDFDETKITLGVSDPKDTFHQLSEYYYEKERFKKIFESKMEDIATKYQKLAVESMSCKIALEYFEEQFSGKSSFTFEAKTITKRLGSKERLYYDIVEMQPHLNLYGLRGFDIVQGEKKTTKSYHGKHIITYDRSGEASYIELKVEML